MQNSFRFLEKEKIITRVNCNSEPMGTNIASGRGVKTLIKNPF